MWFKVRNKKTKKKHLNLKIIFILFVTVMLNCLHYLVSNLQKNKQININFYSFSTHHCPLPIHYLGLEFLDLSGNHIARVDGLQDSPKLKFVNLSNNAELDVKVCFFFLLIWIWLFVQYTLAVMSQKHQFLQQVSFCVLQPNHKRHPDSVRLETFLFYFLWNWNKKWKWK